MDGAASPGGLGPGGQPGPEASEEGRLSPAGPGRPPSSFSFPATPSAFYRSGFARDCEAIALQLRAGAEPEQAQDPAEAAPPPPPSRCPSTIEAETLTPLGPSWSFLSETFRTPAGERSAEPGPERPPPPPPPERTPNRTYDYEEGEAGSGSSADSRATYLCEEDPDLWAAAAASPPAGEPLAEASSLLPAHDHDDASSSSKARRQTFELPAGPDDDSRAAAPLVTSTPLLAGLPGSQPGGGGGKRIALEEEGTRGGGRGPGPEPDSAPRSRPRPPMARPLPGSRTSLGSTRGRAAGKGLLARKNLAQGKGAPPAKGVAVGLPLPGKGVKRAILPPACHGMPGDLRRGSALSGNRPGCPRPSQLQGQKQPPDEMKKCLSKLPCYKGTSVAIQAPPNHTRGGVAGGSLAYVGLGHNASCAENEMPGTKLPVRIAGDKISKTGAQKRLQEKPADSSSVQKPPLPKRACQSRGLMEKHAGGTLLAAGQIPRAVPGNGPVALCLKCVQLSEENQRLTEEIQQLKAMLDNCMCKELQLPIGGSCQHSAAMFQVWSEEDAK